MENRKALPLPTFKDSRDRNGNKTVKVSPPNARAFSIQTLGNLPQTHRYGVHPATLGEVRKYVSQHGTPAQKAAFQSLKNSPGLIG